MTHNKSIEIVVRGERSETPPLQVERVFGASSLFAASHANGRGGMIAETRQATHMRNHPYRNKIGARRAFVFFMEQRQWISSST